MSVNLVKQRFPQLLTALDRAPMAGLLCAVALLFGVVLAWTRAAPYNGRSILSTEESKLGDTADAKILGDSKNNHLGEGGEIINQTGYFRTAGNRVTFISADEKQHFIALENASLERVAKALAADRVKSEWIVSGRVSIYRGETFLLLNRAELKDQAAKTDVAHEQ